jgi:hypothetical protein
MSIEDYQKRNWLSTIKRTLEKDVRLTQDQRNVMLQIATDKPVFYVNATITKVQKEWNTIFVNAMECYEIFEKVIFPVAKFLDDSDIFTLPWKNASGLKIKVKGDCSMFEKGTMFTGTIELSVYCGYQDKHGLFFQYISD